MKPIIIISASIAPIGKIILAEEEFRSLIDDVYEQGRQDGLRGDNVKQIAREIYELQKGSARNDK